MLDLKKNETSNDKTSAVLIFLRKELHLTQKDIASRFQVSAQAVSKWERGENLPESRLLLSISRFYNVSVDELLLGKLNNSSKKTLQINQKNYLIIFGSLLLFISMISKAVFGLSDTFSSNVISMIFLSFGVLLLLIVSLYNDSTHSGFNNYQKALFSFSVVVYFMLNYFFNLWDISWTIFVMAYGIAQFQKTTKKAQQH